MSAPSSTSPAVYLNRLYGTDPFPPSVAATSTRSLQPRDCELLEGRLCAGQSWVTAARMEQCQMFRSFPGVVLGPPAPEPPGVIIKNSESWVPTWLCHLLYEVL